MARARIGSVYQFIFDGYVFSGIYVLRDPTFGYLFGFINSAFKDPKNLDQDEILGEIELYAYIPINKLLRDNLAICVGKIQNFRDFTPLLRSVGGYSFEGRPTQWFIYNGQVYIPVAHNNPLLPTLSDVRICGIGSVKEVLENRISARDSFMDLEERL